MRVWFVRRDLREVCSSDLTRSLAHLDRRLIQNPSEIAVNRGNWAKLLRKSTRAASVMVQKFREMLQRLLAENGTWVFAKRTNTRFPCRAMTQFGREGSGTRRKGDWDWFPSVAYARKFCNFCRLVSLICAQLEPHVRLCLLERG